MKNILCEYLDKWIKNGEQAGFVDDSVAGMALIKLYESTGDKRYHHGAAMIANFLAQAPKNSEESIIYNPSTGNDLIYADNPPCSLPGTARFFIKEMPLPLPQNSC